MRIELSDQRQEYDGPMPPKPLHPTSVRFHGQRVWIEGPYDPHFDWGVVKRFEAFIEKCMKEWIK